MAADPNIPEQSTQNPQPAGNPEMPPIDNTAYMPPVQSAETYEAQPVQIPAPDTRYNPYAQPQYQDGGTQGYQPSAEGFQPAQQYQPAQQAYQQPYDQQYQQPYGAPYDQQYQQPYGQPVIEDKSGMFTLIAILEILFLGGLFAIIPLVFARQYKGALNMGDWERAEQKKKATKTWLIICPCIAIVVLLLAYATGVYSV